MLRYITNKYITTENEPKIKHNPRLVNEETIRLLASQFEEETRTIDQPTLIHEQHSPDIREIAEESDNTVDYTVYVLRCSLVTMSFFTKSARKCYYLLHNRTNDNIEETTTILPYWICDHNNFAIQKDPRYLVDVYEFNGELDDYFIISVFISKSKTE